ncbi:hypothetical protein EBR25_13500 [bacterium]|nr:hypothetical protein [bacterium]
MSLFFAHVDFCRSWVHLLKSLNCFASVFLLDSTREDFLTRADWHDYGIEEARHDMSPQKLVAILTYHLSRIQQICG